MGSAKHWTFTLKTAVEEQENTAALLELFFVDEDLDYVFQLEQGAGANGFLHFQGYCCFRGRRKNRFDWFKSRLTALFCPNARSCHWECVRSVPKCKLYCCKTDTRVGDDYYSNIRHEIDQMQASKTKGKDPEQPVYTDAELGLLSEDQFYHWQSDLVQLLSGEPDDRAIHWIWEPVGRTGKSALSKWLVVKMDAAFCMGKTSDIAHMITTMALKDKKHPRIIIFDIPRTMLERINYQAIESIKNGMVMSGKYESSMQVFPVPHVIVFANAEPNRGALSEDRWEVKALHNDMFAMTKTMPVLNIIEDVFE